MKMEINVPNTYHVAVHGQDVAISTTRWGEDFILQGLNRAVNEFVRQHSARGPVALTDAITALEAASWRKLPISPVGKAKRLIAKLSPEEREMLREALSERHEGKPGK